MKLKEIAQDFHLEAGQTRKPSHEKGLTALQEAPELFKQAARAILSGCFLVKSGSKEVRIYPTCVEIYYHEECGDGVKDPIVYHRNRPQKSEPCFPLGVLHNHVSGIDITFEHDIDNPSNPVVRASALIREFRIGKEGANETRSTYLYQALYGQFSIFDGFTVSWEDGDEQRELSEPTVRKNVAVYEEKGADFEKIPYKDSHKANGVLKCQSTKHIQDLRKWQFRLR